MYIKPNVKGAIIALAVVSQAMDFSAHINLGMTTNPYELVYLNHLTRDQLSTYRKSVLNEDRKTIANALGFNMPEFFDVYAYGRHELQPGLEVQPFINAKLLDNRVDFGVESVYSTTYFDDALSLKGFLTAYRSLFVDEISYVDQSINVDGGAKIDVTMTPYFSVYLELRHPFVSGFTLEANEREVPINNIPSVAIGATINILADYGAPQDDVLMIIQEPISIPVVEIKIEEPKEPEEVVVVPEIIIEPEALLEDDSEDLGWFAWIIEFIAKLFRF